MLSFWIAVSAATADLQRDCFLVGKGDRLGVIGSDGAVRTPLKYRAASRWGDTGYLWVSGYGDPPLDGNFINAKGFEVSTRPVGLEINALAFELPEFRNGRAAVRTGSASHGFLGPDGKILYATSAVGAAMHHLDPWMVIREGDDMGFATVAEGVVIEPQFDEAFPFGGDLAPVREGPRWGLVRRDGSYAVRSMYDEIRLLTRRGDRPVFWAVRLEDRWGIVDSGGNVPVPPRFDSIRHADHGVATVTVDDKFGVIEIASNQMLAPPHYESALPLDRQGVWLQREGRWGRIGIDGREQCPFNVERVSRLGETHWRIWRHGRCGVVSESGEEIVETIYSDISSLSTNLARVRVGQEFGLFDLRARKLLLKPEYQGVRVYSQFRESIALVKLVGRWGAVDLASGAPVIPIESDAIDPWWPSLLIASKDGSTVLYSYTGETVLSPDLEADLIELPQDFVQGYGRIQSKGKAGLITSRGRIAIPCRYEDVGVVADGLVPAEMDGRWGYLDLDGTWRIKPVYGEAHPFSGGVAAARKDGRVGYIDQDGVTVIPFRYDDGRCTYNGLFPVALQDQKSKAMLWGLLNQKSEVVLPIEYEALEWPHPGRQLTTIHGRQTWRSL
ncbi:MAG: WG repeat-containing protein [Verrucomicrobia bacterium]|nr:WG repeat-containing protein [Verrucomicrobiota bacterium]MDA1086157.1 WG repeat-containing protein [Verrucomicrobiota bacterium]